MHVWWIGLRWAEACRMQEHRAREVAVIYSGSMNGAKLRGAVSSNDPLARSWRAAYDRGDHEELPRWVPTHALLMQLETEVDLLL